MLKKAIAKYGTNNFIRKIVCNCNNQSELNYMEELFIQHYNAVEDDSFYNLVAGGGGIQRYKFTEEQKQHMRKHHSPMNEDTKTKWVESHKNKLTDDGRKKLSQNAIKSLTGFVHSEQSKKNMSDAHKGSKSMYKDGIYKNVVSSLINDYILSGWIFKSPPKPSKKVKCVNILDNSYLIFTNVKEASDKTGVREATIRSNIQKNRTTKKKYKFSWISNYADELE